MKIYIYFILLSFATTACSAQSFCDKLYSLKKQCYGFTPRKFTDEQMKAKSAELDKFWTLAMSDTIQSPGCLKQMILAETKDPYFCFDASSLLLRLDYKKQYLDVVAEGLKKSDLHDLQLETYLQMAFFLGANGQDIAPLTEKLISYPNAHVFLTMHVITLSAIDASLFLYNQMGTLKAESSLFNTIANGNSTGKHNAAVVLNLVSTPRGDSLINALMANKQLADSTQKFILKDREAFILKTACDSSINRDEFVYKLKSFPADNPENYRGFTDDIKQECSPFKLLKPEDTEVIRDARNRSLRGISDEALAEYFALTRILMTVRNQ